MECCNLKFGSFLYKLNYWIKLELCVYIYRSPAEHEEGAPAIAIPPGGERHLQHGEAGILDPN